jgi:hypothetical protein
MPCKNPYCEILYPDCKGCKRKGADIVKAPEIKEAKQSWVPED